jgi:hypothetical protein
MKETYTNKQLLLSVCKDIKQLKDQKRDQIIASTFYDNADVKVLLKVCDRTLYRYRTQKLIPYVKIGKKFFYPRQFFERSMNNSF